MIADANTARGFQMTCTDYLTDTRGIGLTLGKCDLSFLSDKDTNEIEDICGAPGATDTGFWHDPCRLSRERERIRP